jgi:hypothetical protein
MPLQVDVVLTMKDREGREVLARKSDKPLPVFVEVEDLHGRRALIPKEELEKVTSCSDVKIICDNPKCAPVLIQWNQEEAGKDENHLPDAAYKIIKITDFVGKEYLYCSPKCAAEHLPKLVLPKSPREQAKVVDISTYKKPVQITDKEKA